jgi:hypothetical protein
MLKELVIEHGRDAIMECVTLLKDNWCPFGLMDRHYIEGQLVREVLQAIFSDNDGAFWVFTSDGHWANASQLQSRPYPHSTYQIRADWSLPSDEELGIGQDEQQATRIEHVVCPACGDTVALILQRRKDGA